MDSPAARLHCGGMLPTVLRASGFWFYFDVAANGSANSGPTDRPHVRVRRGSAEAKVWIEDVRIEEATGFGGADLRKIRGMTRAHRSFFLDAWKDYVGREARERAVGSGTVPDGSLTSGSVGRKRRNGC
jgi:hypothetical protein